MTEVPSGHGLPGYLARRRTVDALREGGVVAVIRLSDVTRAMEAAKALADGGVTALEVTLTTPGALTLIEALAREPGCLVGAGSVLDAQQARDAVAAGARYLVSPAFHPELITVAHAHDVPAMPGAYTPTEMLQSYRAGADVVKVFPADGLGPGYLRNVLAPMPFLELMPTGGVTPENAGTWIQAGAVAVGIGSALVDPTLVAAGDWSALTARARTACASVHHVRSPGAAS